MHTSNTQHVELKKSRITKDEKAVSEKVEVIQELVNPFKESQELINISNGTVSNADIAKAKACGESSYKAFRQKRLETDPPMDIL